MIRIVPIFHYLASYNSTSVGFASGGVYEDYTMCTPLRDHRSAGSILSKLVASVLQQIGVHLWYWGYKMKYMEDYIKYGAREIDRSEFYEVIICKSIIKLLSALSHIFYFLFTIKNNSDMEEHRGY